MFKKRQKQIFKKKEKPFSRDFLTQWRNDKKLLKIEAEASWRHFSRLIFGFYSCRFSSSFEFSRRLSTKWACSGSQRWKNVSTECPRKIQRKKFSSSSISAFIDELFVQVAAFESFLKGGNQWR